MLKPGGQFHGKNRSRFKFGSKTTNDLDLEDKTHSKKTPVVKKTAKFTFVRLLRDN